MVAAAELERAGPRTQGEQEKGIEPVILDVLPARVVSPHVPIFPSIGNVIPVSNPVKSQEVPLERTPLARLDSSVLRNFIGEDQGIVEQAYYDLLPVVNACLRRVQCPFDMREDIAQEVMHRIWMNGPTFDPGRGDLSGWIYMIARNAVIDHGRKVERRPKAQDLGDEEMDAMWNSVNAGISGEDDVELQVINRDLLRKVFEVINSFPSSQREVVLLSLFSGLTQKEIAEAMGIPLGTVKTRAFRGNGRLQELAAELT